MSELIFYRKSVQSLTKEEFSACYRTNFGMRGMMQETLKEARDEDYLKATAFMLWRERDGKRELLSWVLRFWSNNRWNIYVYTKTMERKKGYGSFVVKEAKRGVRSPIAIFPWDKRSDKFYKNFKQENIVNARADDYDVESEGYVGI